MPKTDMSINFGNWMRHRRKELGLTQPQVAKRITEQLPTMAADKQRISDWERGYNMPSDAYKPAIAHALEVEDVGYFYRPYGEEAEQPNLLDALSPRVDVSVQLDRIEGLVNQLLERIVAADVRAAVEEDRKQAQSSARAKRPPRAA